MLVFLEAFVRIFFSALSSAGSWILGFVLGKFLDFLGKVGWRPNQEQRKPSQEPMGLEGSSPPSKSSRKHAQSKPRSSRNHPKTSKNRALTPAKSMPKRFQTRSRSNVVLTTNKEGRRKSFRNQFFRILIRLGPQDGPMLEAKMDPKSIKNQCPKTMKFWRPLGRP